jgi:hypothetical protein
VRCGRSVADPPDDPVVVEAVGEVARAINRLLEFLNTCYAPPPAGWIAGAHDTINAAGLICQLFTGDFKEIIDWIKRSLKWHRGESAALNMAAMCNWSPIRSIVRLLLILLLASLLVVPLALYLM